MAEGAAEQEPFDITDVLPLLPVRDLVVFPAQVVPLFVSREISLSAVEAATTDSPMTAPEYISIIRTP